MSQRISPCTRARRCCAFALGTPCRQHMSPGSIVAPILYAAPGPQRGADGDLRAGRLPEALPDPAHRHPAWGSELAPGLPHFRCPRVVLRLVSGARIDGARRPPDRVERCSKIDGAVMAQLRPGRHERPDQEPSLVSHIACIPIRIALERLPDARVPEHLPRKPCQPPCFRPRPASSRRVAQAP